MFQFGVSIGSWNTVEPVWVYQLDWTKTQIDNNNAYITTSTNLGAMLGSILAPYLFPYGKVRMIALTNIVYFIAIALCMFQHLYIFFAGRFLWGFCAGVFSTLCPKFISEMSPREMMGPLGGINQFMVTFGIALPAMMALVIPNPDTNPDKDSFLINQYWRVIYVVPAAIAFIQLILLFTAFNYETPIDLKKKGQHDKLLVLMRKMYDETEVARRIDEIKIGDLSPVGAESE